MSVSKSANNKFRIAFDVNGTLTHPLVRQFLSILDREKCFLVVWSSMGAEYAQEYCEDVGIDADAYWDKNAHKVDLAVDDLGSTVSNADLLFEVVRKFH